MEREFENKVAVVTGGAKGIGECICEEFEYAQRVGVTAPFYLTKLFLPHFAPGASIVNISSGRDRMSQPQSESCTAAKGGIAALTHACIDGGMTRQMIYHNDSGWKLEE